MTTVAREIPSRPAIRDFGTPTAASLLISAQSSTEITQPICLGGLIFERCYDLIFERCRHMAK